MSATEAGDEGCRRVIAWPARAWPGDDREARVAGGRLRLTHGPISLIFDLAGDRGEVEAAEAAARRCFDGLLERLVAELAILRAPAGASGPMPDDRVAAAMWRAVLPFADEFITPMAAVAGAVADHVLAAIRAEAGVTRAAINNGGDIALFLSGGERYRLGIHDGRPRGRFVGFVDLTAGDAIGGIATSGWRGRSHSLGIADAVTVLAATAAEADAAATMIANAVDLPGSPRVRRAPASTLAPDSDLGDRLVTVGVASLSAGERAEALAHGLRRAEAYLERGLIQAAFLSLDGDCRNLGHGPNPKPLAREDDRG